MLLLFLFLRAFLILFASDRQPKFLCRKPIKHIKTITKVIKAIKSYTNIYKTYVCLTKQNGFPYENLSKSDRETRSRRAGRQINRRTGRQTDRQLGRARQADRQTDRQTQRQADKQ